MKHESLAEKDARSRVAMFDIDDLVSSDRPGNTNPYAKEMESLTDLLKVVQAFEPSVIIGVSAVSGAFTPAVLQHMAAINKERPLVLALSNPTS
ncbi:NADP-dependent malic enzyme [Tyrophagus putrescentiae]|nr:NADP-dependent malic enzyme [Tyrophagus putrescentiae]